MGSVAPEAASALPANVAFDWSLIRRLVLARDGSRCQDCGAVGSSGDLDVHHLVPRSSGGTDEPANLITLCDGCHGRRHPNLQVSLSRRMIERWALRLARLLDRDGELPEELSRLSLGLRLLGVEVCARGNSTQ
jgi:ATP-dependent DNA helicase RecQ